MDVAERIMMLRMFYALVAGVSFEYLHEVDVTAGLSPDYRHFIINNFFDVANIGSDIVYVEFRCCRHVMFSVREGREEGL
jgi:hypothetical protein